MPWEMAAGTGSASSLLGDTNGLKQALSLAEEDALGHRNVAAESRKIWSASPLLDLGSGLGSAPPL